MWVFARIMLKEPILPWRPKKENSGNMKFRQRKSKNKQVTQEELDKAFIRDLLGDMKEVSHHMLIRHDNTFVLFAEVHPCNYFLLSQEEQNNVDNAFERWLASLDFENFWYLQNRFIDLSDPIQEMRKNMREGEDLPEQAKQYGEALIEHLQAWQDAIPRYETKRYILFTYKLKQNTIIAENEEEFKEKAYDKAFAELFRNFNATQEALKRCKVEINLLTNEGIIEVLYHALNRKKALKNKFKDIAKREMLAEFVTADKDIKSIEEVREMIQNDQTVQEKVG